MSRVTRMAEIVGEKAQVSQSRRLFDGSIVEVLGVVDGGCRKGESIRSSDGESASPRELLRQTESLNFAEKRGSGVHTIFLLTFLGIS